jgi:hypothetical protein
VKKNAALFLRPVFFSVAVLAWTGCPYSTAATAGNQNQEAISADDTGAPPLVAADPGDAEDAALVPASRDISALGLANPLLIVFSETAAPAITGGTNAAAEAAGNTVTVTLAGEGADIVAQGLCAGASLVLSGNYDFNLYLNGLGLANPDGAAINNDGAGTMNVILVEGTANRLTDGAAGGQKAAFYSKGDFAISGGGSLEARGKAAHAIAAKGAFTQTGGTILVKEAAKDGINAKTVDISGGAFTARTKGDGIQGDEGVSITGGALSIVTTADDVKAHGVKSGGNIVIGTGGGGSAPDIAVAVYGDGSKCISADGDMAVHSGVLSLNTAGNGYWDTGSAEADKTAACAGIKCDGDLSINGGSLTLVSAGTGGKGISVDGDITINNGTIDVATTGEAYVYNNVYDTKSKAVKSDNNLTINNGTITIRTYTDGAEGLECEYALTINGGLIEINSYDDAINASGGDDGRSGRILIAGGRIFCNASGNDGIDSNGTIAITGGTVISLGSAAPEEGFDCDNNTFAITGGTLIGFGGATSKPTASATTQCSVECNINYASLYHIESADGADIMTFEMPRSYNGTVCMLFGGGEMIRGTNYTLYSGGSVSGGENFHGLYTGAAYAKGNVAGTFTGSAYATVGTASGSPGQGGRPGTPGTPPPWTQVGLAGTH